ncbi:TonB-dependent receptor [Rhodocytophaga rosea]|uniref:TonB-dependent receptor n=1 Tax=Rhodocytophaga rosea TaxID=2704465 RepID=A0A6C0GCW5_9BACT|nr:TonB-dependent receptor [Rhodocytophaga rosea]QHT65694.1 TonB-dependent receptor [Rhodocytophaga rosea]
MNTAIANASVGYQFNDKLSAIVSGNYQGRGRDVSYYHPMKDRFYNTPDSLTYLDEKNKAKQRYPHPDRAMDKYGANLFLRFNPTNKIHLSLSSGLQNSEVQNSYNAYFVSTLTTAKSKSGYADLKANIYGLSAQISYLNGKQDPHVGSVGSMYDFSTLDAILEYEIKLTNNLSVKPGANFRKAIYDDTRYWDATKNEGNLSARTQLDTYAGSLRVDYKAFNEKLRLVGGARIDKFTYPDKGFVSYQLAANYKPSERHLIRAVYSRAYRSAFIFDTYLNLVQRAPMTGPGLPEGSYTEAALMGNKNLNMLQSDLLELGYRSKLADNLSFDLEAYYNTTKDYTGIIAGASTFEPGATPSDPIAVKTLVKIENLPLSVRQLGTTISVNYVLNRLQVKPFLTFQKTTLYDYSKYSNTADAFPTASNNGNAAEYNMYSGLGTKMKHQFTPAVFGGAYINYQVSQKLNINVNPYYYSAQTFYHQDNLTFHDNTRGIEHIDPKLLLNATVNYSPVKPISLFVTVKNLLNNSNSEYYRTDRIGSMILVGASLRY